MILLALLLLALQSEPRGEGLVISGLPLGAFAGEARVEKAGEEVVLELHTERGERAVSLSFWSDEVTVGERWRARGSSRFSPEGLTQRLELVRGDARLVFLDNAERGADLVAGWQLGRIEAKEVYLSSEGEVKRLRLGATLSLNERWFVTLLGVSLPDAPSQAYADEVTEPKADLLVMRQP